MRISRRTAVVLASAFIAMPAITAAQEPVKSFELLNTRLKPGDTVWVTDAQGREVKGKITSLGADALTLNADGAKSFPGGHVRLVQERRPDSLANGALIGFAVGAGGIGIACLATAEDQDKGWCLAAALVYGGVGTGIGVAIDALIPGKKLVVYRASGPAGAPPARVLFAPVITPRAKGVALSFTF